VAIYHTQNMIQVLTINTCCSLTGSKFRVQNMTDFTE